MKYRSSFPRLHQRCVASMHVQRHPNKRWMSRWPIDLTLKAYARLHFWIGEWAGHLDFTTKRVSNTAQQGLAFGAWRLHGLVIASTARWHQNGATSQAPRFHLAKHELQEKGLTWV